MSLIHLSPFHRRQESSCDSTDTPTLGFSSFLLPSTASVRYSYPTPGNHSSTSDHIKKVYKGLSLDHMKTFLKEFSGFRTRYYRSETGKASQQFLLKTIGEVRCSSYPI